MTTATAHREGRFHVIDVPVAVGVQYRFATGTQGYRIDEVLAGDAEYAYVRTTRLTGTYAGNVDTRWVRHFPR